METAGNDEKIENSCQSAVGEPEPDVTPAGGRSLNRRKLMEEREQEVDDKAGGEEEVQSIEMIFKDQKVPPWQKQLTFRALFVSFLLGILFSFIVMKLILTTGIIPSLNISAGLLGFFFVKTWTKFLEKSKLLKHPFTRQENTVIQTCVVAASGIAYSGTNH
ncbi:hypothetical protein F0562_005954 [Nyssa sinensis]|uniref:Uncharacterized protein n=1 Tax=Nyssa sinensis TaxID=561372 RepID=A0A5J5AJL1_9ASTE|nr:hypothetical protein F0562_005954 [Nyssa sinensis]